MRNLQKIYQECVKECKDANLPIQDDKVIDVGELKEGLNIAYGSCVIDKIEDNYSIYVHLKLLDNNCDIKELKEVIIHELIHTCPRCGIHSKTWMRYAKIMNEKYGYELTTAKDDDSVFHKDKPILRQYICSKCNSILNLRTVTERDDKPTVYHICPFCRSHYKKIF